MKSKKNVVKDVVKPTAISPKSSFTDPNDPWSAKANVAENITSKRANLLKQFYKSKGWNVDYISKNKKVSQSKTGEYEKWKRDHGIYEEDQIDEVSNELLGRYKTAAGSQASELDKAGGKENIQKANKRFSGIVKATKKQFANDDKKQDVAEGSVKLTEVSKKFLGRYVNKARSDRMDAIHGYYRNADDDLETDETDSKRLDKRDRGLALARAKINKSGKSGNTTTKVKATEDVSESSKPTKKEYLKKLDQNRKDIEDTRQKGVAEGKESKDAGEYDYEGAMAKTQLQTICRNAEDLKNMLKDDENLPEWVQAKITKAEDYVTTSLDYMKSTAELEEQIGLDEVLSKDAKAYDWIHDFVHSDNPKFAGKSTKKRQQMALAAYYAKQRNEDSVDPQAATQSPADGANGGETLAPQKKSIKRIVKEFYSSSRQVQEDLYDWEKDDKAAKPYGKKPSVQKLDGVNNIGDDKPNARLILKGGKTLTGEPRDTVEIDPMMKNRSKMPDYKSMDKIKQKPQEQ